MEKYLDGMRNIREKVKRMFLQKENNEMYSIGDYVVYSTAGICKISDIKTEDFYGDIKTYYIIETVYGNKSVVHVPSDNELLMSKMRKPHTKEEITQIIEKAGREKVEWIDDYKTRNEQYNSIIKSGDSLEIAKVLKAAYMNEKECIANNKKISMTDKKITDTAEKMIFQEFATMFEMSFEEVKEVVMNKLNV